MKKFLCLAFVIGILTSLQAQIYKSDWNLNPVRNPQISADVHPFFSTAPTIFNTVTLDASEIFSRIKKEKQHIEIPDMDGNFMRFEIWPIEVVPETSLSSRSAKTFRGQAVRNPSIKLSLTIYDQAIYVCIYGSNENQYIIPAGNGNLSLIYRSSDELNHNIECYNPDHDVDREEMNQNLGNTMRNDVMRTFRAAFTATGEYSQKYGGSPYDIQNVHNAITAGLNMLNPILERDLGVTLINVTPDALIFEDPLTDPFLDSYTVYDIISTNQSTVTNLLGLANFDVGHVLHVGSSGGVANVSSICNDNIKAKGISRTNNSPSYHWMRMVAHEMGHQLGMYHNHSTSNCNAMFNHKFEPGSGSSIMSYAGACGNNYQMNTEYFYHAASIARHQTMAFTCAEVVPGANIIPPTVDADVASLEVPKNTPFVLVGSGNAAVYDWNQYDGTGEPTSTSPSGTCTDCANFKFAPPNSEVVRHFPDLQENLLNGNDIAWEKLSSVPRTMNFKLTGRSYPGIGTADVAVEVLNTGPFEITYPNGGEVLQATSHINATWNVNGTDSHAPTVDILFSTDDGDTFTVLSENTPNDGEETITLPATQTITGYLLIQRHIPSGEFRSASTFYDVSDANITIGPSVLPVHLVNFQGKREGDQTMLNWATASEENVSHFNLYRASHDENWILIDKIKAEGNSSKIIRYHYTDNDSYATYYKLTVEDLDGAISADKVIYLPLDAKEDLVAIYPNPVQHTLHIKLPSDKAYKSISILDFYGRTLQKHIISGSVDLKSMDIDVENIPSGLYTVVVEGESIQTLKMLKN